MLLSSSAVGRQGWPAREASMVLDDPPGRAAARHSRSAGGPPRLLTVKAALTRDHGRGPWHEPSRQPISQRIFPLVSRAEPIHRALRAVFTTATPYAKKVCDSCRFRAETYRRAAMTSSARAAASADCRCRARLCRSIMVREGGREKMLAPGVSRVPSTPV